MIDTINQSCPACWNMRVNENPKDCRQDLSRIGAINDSNAMFN